MTTEALPRHSPFTEGLATLSGSVVGPFGRRRCRVVADDLDDLDEADGGRSRRRAASCSSMPPSWPERRAAALASATGDAIYI
jgi:hypothetical protein